MTTKKLSILATGALCALSLLSNTMYGAAEDPQKAAERYAWTQLDQAITLGSMHELESHVIPYFAQIGVPLLGHRNSQAFDGNSLSILERAYQMVNLNPENADHHAVADCIERLGKKGGYKPRLDRMYRSPEECRKGIERKEDSDDDSGDNAAAAAQLLRESVARRPLHDNQNEQSQDDGKEDSDDGASSEDEELRDYLALEWARARQELSQVVSDAYPGAKRGLFPNIVLTNIPGTNRTWASRIIQEYEDNTDLQNNKQWKTVYDSIKQHQALSNNPQQLLPILEQQSVQSSLRPTPQPQPAAQRVGPRLQPTPAPAQAAPSPVSSLAQSAHNAQDQQQFLDSQNPLIKSRNRAENAKQLLGALLNALNGSQNSAASARIGQLLDGNLDNHATVITILKTLSENRLIDAIQQVNPNRGLLAGILQWWNPQQNDLAISASDLSRNTSYGVTLAQIALGDECNFLDKPTQVIIDPIKLSSLKYVLQEQAIRKTLAEDGGSSSY